MADLSSNWKKLQAQLKAEAATREPAKRTAQDSNIPSRQKIIQISKRRKPTLDRKTHTMGGVQSSLQSDKLGQSPSSATWVEDKISAEDIAGAYNLGLKSHFMILAAAKDRVNHGLSERLEVGKYVAVDCEMVGVGPGGYESALARVSVVDFHGQQVYDSYVKPKEFVTDWRTAVSGISRKEMRFARDFNEVQEHIQKILKNRVLIGHDVKHDLSALKLTHPLRDIRDTARHHGFKKYGNGRKPALKTLAKQILNVEIQEGPHSSTEDARATMLLFRKDKSGFDVDHAHRYRPKHPAVNGSYQRRKSKRKH